MLPWPGRKTLPLADLTLLPSTYWQKVSGGYQFSQKFSTLYSEFIKDVGGNESETKSCLNKLKQAGITVLPQVDFASPQQVRISKIERGGAIFIYQVRLGHLVMEVTLLNLSGDHQNTSKSIQKGTFGRIVQAEAGNQPCLAKTIAMRGTKIFFSDSKSISWSILSSSEKIEEVVVEYAVCLVCSVLDIGPRVRLSASFDLVCFDDEIQFLMECCEPVLKHLEYSSLFAFEKRLTYCIRLLHQFGIVHRDIKPANIVFSSRLQDFVIIDFGVSMAVWEKPGFLTRCYREGTARFMSPELKALKVGMAGRVDLFWNDLYGLRITCIELTRSLDMGESEEIVLDDEPLCKIDRLVELAYSIYRSLQCPTIKTSFEEMVEVEALSLFEESFPQLCEEASKQENKRFRAVQYNASFLVRCLGPTFTALELLESNDTKSELDRAMIEYIVSQTKTKSVNPEQGPTISQNQPTGERTPIKNSQKVTEIKTLLLQQADLAIEKGGLDGIVSSLSELKDYEELPNLKQLYEWLIIVSSGTWTQDIGYPPNLWNESRVLIVEAAAMHYWAGNLQQAVLLLRFIAKACRANQDAGFVRLAVLLLKWDEIQQDCFELLFRMLMDHLTRQRKWQEIGHHTDSLLVGNHVPRMLMASVHYYRGNALLQQRLFPQAISIFSISLQLLSEQPRTNKLQVATVNLQIGSCRNELGQYDEAMELLFEGRAVFSEAGPVYSEYHFQSVALIATSYYTTESRIKGGEMARELTKILDQDRCNWVMYSEDLGYYLHILYAAFSNGCTDSGERLVTLTINEVSGRFAEMDNQIEVQTAVRNVLYACVACRKMQKAQQLTTIIQNSIRSFSRKFCDDKVLRESSFTNEQIVDCEPIFKIISILSARNDLNFDLVGFSSILLFKFLLISGNAQFVSHFSKFWEVFKTRIALFCNSFQNIFQDLASVFQQEKDQESIEFLLELPFADRNSFLLRLGLCLSAKEEYKQSIEVLLQILKTYSSDPKLAYFQLCAENSIATSLMKLGLVLQSRIHFRRAIEINKEFSAKQPDNSEYRRSIAKLLTDIGEVEEALSWLRTLPLWNDASEINLGDSEAYFLTTKCLISLKMYRQGLWAVRRAKTANSQNPQSYQGGKNAEFHECLCLCQLSKFRALRRCYVKATNKGTQGEMQNLQPYLSKQSNVLAYSVMGWEPQPGSNLYKFLNEPEKVGGKPRTTKRLIQEITIVKRMLRLIAADSTVRKASLKVRKKDLLQEVGK